MKLTVRGELAISTESGLKINSRIIELLRTIAECGSLNTASKKMGLSYSYAWNLLNKLNCKLETPLFTTHRGGNGGGVSALTENGEKLIAQYDQLCSDFDQFLTEHSILI